MGRKIEFRDNDKELIAEIEKYQKENNIKYFIEAVRQLCRNGLNQNVNVRINFKTITKKENL